MSNILKKEHASYRRSSIMKHLKEFVKLVPDYRRTDKGIGGYDVGVASVFKYRPSHCLAVNTEDVPGTTDKVDVSGCIVTADAMSFKKANIDKIREKGGDFLIELKANQRTLRYGVEDNVELAEPVDVYSEGPFLEHGRIETRVCRIFRGNDLITDREKWNGNLTVVEIRTATERKSDGQKSSERRFYVSSFHGSARRLGTIARMHWAIESMHWDLDRNLRQDFIRRNSARSARNLDTIQRMVLAILSIWKGKRKKPSEKAKGTAELIGELSLDFTAMMHMLDQK